MYSPEYLPIPFPELGKWGSNDLLSWMKPILNMKDMNFRRTIFFSTCTRAALPKFDILAPARILYSK